MELPPLGPRLHRAQPSFSSRSGSPSPPFHYIWQPGSDHTLCRILLRNFWPSLCPPSQHGNGDPGGGRRGHKCGREGVLEKRLAGLQVALVSNAG